MATYSTTIQTNKYLAEQIKQSNIQVVTRTRLLRKPKVTVYIGLEKMEVL